jgi:origin recognition complex subunit 2
MKRKKQVEDSDNSNTNEGHQKRTRSRNGSNIQIEEDDRVDEVEFAPSRRRSSQRGKDTEQSEPNTAAREAPSENDEETENEDDEDEAAEAATESEEDGVAPTKAITPQKGVNGHLSNSAKEAQTNGITPVKDLRGKKLFSTPAKTNGTTDDTPKIERHVDRSARRKSTRNLIERTVLGTTSDNDEEDEDIAQHIYGSGEEGVEEDAVQEDMELDGEVLARPPETASRTPGRRKGSKNKEKSPPPTDLLPHELYFSQNRGGRNKTSNNNLSSLQLLDHEEYFTLLRKFKEPHADDIEWLQELHAGSFSQWQFELSQNFNICLYGWGSKRSLLMKFAEDIYKSQKDHTRNKIVVVNGYVQTLTIRDVLNTVRAAVSDSAPKLGSQPADMLENLLALVDEDSSRHITVIIHSIDRAPLRRPVTQTILSRLSSHPQIHFVASADHPSFPLLWDSSLRSTYNFLFHDCTTFQSYSSEIDVVDEVHELLGRSGRRVGGKEGVSFVLKSLPENAKNLFRVLIGEQLATMDDNSGATFEDDDNEDDDIEARSGNSRRNEHGVEYRVLYQKAVEEFICSNEMNFRTLLKE